eukprot:CAMPEP_0176015858 /NCGR_PEP_ID=MMETSP0120_2-20121206/7553_1 /TAXON_ID=160619 /ORGANISM="Kryptoperidinium foliaceum, Strain CCMP 1326" /LENGTH=76 /DNA_ID=CAMNT_0017348839 /DNA_START=252 /DNA_END=482 /DNA_ORIENTATION=+
MMTFSIAFDKVTNSLIARELTMADGTINLDFIPDSAVPAAFPPALCPPSGIITPAAYTGGLAGIVRCIFSFTIFIR